MRHPMRAGCWLKGSARVTKIINQDADAAAPGPARQIEQICARHGVAPGAAELQFFQRDPRVISTIVGVTRPERVGETIGWATAEIPQAAWQASSTFGFSPDDPWANRVYQRG